MVLIILSSYSVRGSSQLQEKSFRGDVEVVVIITAIRALDRIEDDSLPSFFVRLFLNAEEYTSPIWQDKNDVYPDWSASVLVPESQENISVNIQLWNSQETGDQPCDIRGDASGQYDVNLIYNIHTGYWTGDDYRGDLSGYGRLNGCDDGTIEDDTDRDCELWFMITQSDPDGDGIPSWMETNVYGTDPEIDDSSYDPNHDGIPITWDWKWGYDPFVSDNHSLLDPDNDSITNIEEYLTGMFPSDPFRKDVFLELDFMAESPEGITSRIPDEAVELLKNPFHRRNIVFHVDIGIFDGGVNIPFEEKIGFTQVREIYNTYFLHNETQNWKRSTTHYGIIVYDCTPKGYGFSGDVSPYMGYIPGTNGFIISSKQMEKNAKLSLTKTLEYFYGSAIMHEMGHNFGLRAGHPYGCDVQLSKWPWQIGYWYYRTYKSIMNYHYTYKYFDYSDGTHGKRDFNDWGAVNLSYFEIPYT